MSTPSNSPQDRPQGPDRTAGEDEQRRVMVIGPDGQPTGMVEVGGGEDETGDPSKLVEQPAKVMRIGSMIKQLLEEVRSAPLDEAGRKRLRDIHARSIAELADGLAPELREELDRLAIPFGSDSPSESELRIAQAQLVGWLEGLFHGIQAALMAQQMAARAQLDQIRRMPALPPGAHPPMSGPPGSAPGGPGPGGEHPGSGQYL